MVFPTVRGYRIVGEKKAPFGYRGIRRRPWTLPGVHRWPDSKRRPRRFAARHLIGPVAVVAVTLMVGVPLVARTLADHQQPPRRPAIGQLPGLPGICQYCDSPPPTAPDQRPPDAVVPPDPAPQPSPDPPRRQAAPAPAIPTPTPSCAPSMWPKPKPSKPPRR